MHTRSCAVALATAVCATVAAQTTVYSNAAPRAAATILAGSNVGAPSLRYWGGWATDGARLFNFGGRGVNTAGTALTTYFNGLDAYDPLTNTWTNLSVEGEPTAPTARFRTATAFDPTANRIVVFGGSPSPGLPLDDCFAFDLTSNTWSNIPNPTPGVTGPTGRWDATMQYDPASGFLILFGGQTGNTNAQRVNDTWQLIGTTWVPVSPATSPSPRGLHAMATRSAPYNDIVLVGGQDDLGVNQNDTWRWDGLAQNWVAITPNGGTVPVTSAGGNAMVHDTVRDVLLILGGTGTNIAPSNTSAAGGWTSEYDCLTNEWRAYGNNTVSQSAADPTWGTLQRFCMAFLNGRTYFWAGQNPATPGDANLAFVKEYQANPVASATSYGAGCSGPGGVLTLTSTSLPWTGHSWFGTCTNLGAASLAMIVYGTAVQSLPLSLVLPQAGLGCDLLTSPDVLVGPAVPAGGQLSVSLLIPFDPSLAGVVLYSQVAELEFNGLFQWSGLYSSNGVQITVGAL